MNIVSSCLRFQCRSTNCSRFGTKLERTRPVPFFGRSDVRPPLHGSDRGHLLPEARVSPLAALSSSGDPARNAVDSRRIHRWRSARSLIVSHLHVKRIRCGILGPSEFYGCACAKNRRTTPPCPESRFKNDPGVDTKIGRTA